MKYRLFVITFCNAFVFVNSKSSISVKILNLTRIDINYFLDMTVLVTSPKNGLSS